MPFSPVASGGLGYGYGCQNQWDPSHFGIGEFTAHFRTYFSGDWDVHWGYDLDLDPWPHCLNGRQKEADLSVSRNLFFPSVPPLSSA